MSLDTDKKELRKLIQQQKNQLSIDERNTENSVVFEKLEDLSVFQSAKHILCYWSLPDELETHQFVEKWYHNKNIYLPRVVGDHVEVVPFKGIDSMQKGAFNILEPVGMPIEDLNIIDLVIVPGVAFTVDGYRMGRGGGYYDRLLPSLTNAEKIGICYNCQMVDKIPQEEHDVKMDAVLFGLKYKIE